MAKDLLSLALQSAIRDAEEAGDDERSKILKTKLKAAQKAYAADPAIFDASPVETSADIAETLEVSEAPATKSVVKKTEK